jgi:carbamate kinase
MRIVVALGGNALLRRGEVMTVQNQRANVAVACEHLARIADKHELVVSHGNGPQIGLLALEEASYDEVPDYPLDVLGAETQGMVGYLIEQELANRLPQRSIVTVLTMVEVDPADPAFGDPTKPIGPQYSAERASRLEKEQGWSFRPDGDLLRRVVPSPVPRRIIEVDEIATLSKAGSLVICAGGGGIPTARDDDGLLYGVEGVIDKDLASYLLAVDLGAELFVMATDTPAAYLGFGTDNQAAVVAADPDAILAEHGNEFAAGSMLPKVTAACQFARVTSRAAVIGQLGDIEDLVAGTKGTRIATDVRGVKIAPAVPASIEHGSSKH